MTWAQIVVDPRLTNPKALTNAVAHELGHNFGLLDCYTCKFKTTVMNQFKVVNEPNDMEGPTTCDIAKLKPHFWNWLYVLDQLQRLKKVLSTKEKNLKTTTRLSLFANLKFH